MESAGARVVPIVSDWSQEKIEDMLSKVDGVLFPGGNGDNVDLGKIAFDYVVKQNDQGHFYPAWGTCLGYENMVGYTADSGFDSWGRYDLHKVSLPLDFTVDPTTTKMYGDLGQKAMEFSTNNFTYNSHRFGLDPDTFETDKGLADFWTVTATSAMPNGTNFVASMEAKNYPIFGTQYHPEKAPELWLDGMGINHSWESI